MWCEWFVLIDGTFTLQLTVEVSWNKNLNPPQHYFLITCFKMAKATLDLEKHMLSSLSLASVEICWQLEVDMGVAALLEVGCLSLGCLSQSHLEIRQAFASEPWDVLHTCACQREASLNSPLLLVIVPLKWNLMLNAWKEIVKQSSHVTDIQKHITQTQAVYV